MSLTSASSPVHLTFLFSRFLLHLCIPMGGILWPRKTAGKTQRRLEHSESWGSFGLGSFDSCS
ncbi:hypothetical protein I79_011602 [Cricetulus griseus]|uniref:Uncharacterized protein n=1 Tax=Cricetulus griseus TaxID=10029 RepID=G3HLL2_CRIGR|nr:hypothetical protein I79_011602 [Cricetulus griseus]